MFLAWFFACFAAKTHAKNLRFSILNQAAISAMLFGKCSSALHLISLPAL
jgi:hypothetical protein